MSLFRGGSEEAFRAIHDRYRARMFAYTRQMLSGSAVDAEDAVQEIFVRAYSGLRTSDRELALRAWLYRIAHNRCIDELRRPQSVATEAIPATVPNTGGDPVVRMEQRDALKRLIADVQRLPDQQRSALLMRELTGMTYADVAGALGVSVPAVKSLLVRARVGLAQANEARDTACARIREDLIVAHDRGVRASGLARRHLRDCPHCRQFRTEVRGVSRQLAAFVPALGPLGVIAKVLGIGGGGGAAAGTGALAGSGAGATAAATGAAGGIAGSGAVVGLGALAGTGHVVTILAAAVVTAGGAFELQHMSPPAPSRVHHHRLASRSPTHAPQPSQSSGGASPSASSSGSSVSQTSATPVAGSVAPTTSSAANPLTPSSSSTGTSRHHARSNAKPAPLPLIERLDPDHLVSLYGPGNPLSVTDPTDPTSTPVTSTPSSTTDGTSGAPTTNPNAPVSSTSSSTSTPSSTSSSTATGADGTTAAGTPVSSTSSTGTGQTGAPSAPSSPSSTGSQTGTGSSSSTQSGGKSTKVTSAASTVPSKTSAGSRSHRHGTIAVFTMTGN